MAEKMTLGQVPGALRGMAEVIREHGTCAAMAVEYVADAVDAHLAQPAQVVDVVAIREVIKELKAGARDSCYRTQQAAEREWCDKLTRAIDNRGNGVA